ncbi:MAG: hypothetical protein QG670_799 [Thermoproteota archaeon]|nr:hypothetical protein [Thermoproteota archaeon]
MLQIFRAQIILAVMIQSEPLDIKRSFLSYDNSTILSNARLALVAMPFGTVTG